MLQNILKEALFFFLATSANKFFQMKYKLLVLCCSELGLILIIEYLNNINYDILLYIMLYT